MSHTEGSIAERCSRIEGDRVSREDGRYMIRARGRLAERMARYAEDSGAPTDNAAILALVAKGLDALDGEQAARAIRPERTDTHGEG
jgi:hypothetical protein